MYIIKLYKEAFNVKNKFIKIGAGALLAVVIFSTTAFTQSYSRNINAWFNNIKVKIDGKEVLLDEEPFVFDDDLYLPASILERGLDLDYIFPTIDNFVDIQTNGKLDFDSGTSLSPVIQQKSYEIQNLSRQLEEMEKELSIIKQDRFHYRYIGTLEEMQTYLMDHFKNLEGISMTIKLTHLGGSSYRIAATSSSGSYNLSNLDRRSIEGWVEDMFYAIRQLYDAKANVKGYLRPYSSSQSNYVEYYTSNNRLYFEFSRIKDKRSSQVDGVKLEEKLNKGSLRRYNNVSFTYEVFVNRYDIDLMIYFHSDNFYDWTASAKMNFINAIKRQIEDFSYYINVSGKIIDKNKNKNATVFNFGIVDGEVRSFDLLRDIEDYLNNNMHMLYFNNNIFNFKYDVQEGGDGNIVVNLKGDFAREDNKWTESKEYVGSSLKNFVSTAYRYVENQFDKDISGEIVDKNQEFIGTLKYYKPSGQYFRTLENIDIQ